MRFVVRAVVSLWALHATTMSAQVPAQPPTRLIGVAFDSVAMRPITDAVVRAVPARDPSSARVVRTDSLGRFRIDSLVRGRWLATVLHPVFDTLELEPPVAYIEVQEGGDVEVVLSTLSPRAIVRERCGVMASDLGLLFGYARRATDDSAAAGAVVRAAWPEWTMQDGARGMRSQLVSREAITAPQGRFMLCGVPRGNVVRVQAIHGSDSSSALEIPNDSSGVTRRDLLLAPGGGVVRPAADSAELGYGAQRLGAGTVIGRVRDINDRPIVGAIVRVMGSGDPARTDSSGAYVVRRAVIGTQMVEARALGFQPVRRLADLRSDVAIELQFTLATRQVDLDTVRVTADRTVSPALLSLENRMRSGVGGTFLDGDAVRRQATRFVSDALLRVNGVRVTTGSTGVGQRILMRRSDGRWCLPQVFVDGVAVHTGVPVPRSDSPKGEDSGEMFLDDFITLDEVAAVEVYPRFALVPVQFQTLSGCGAVVVWTKSQFGGVSVRDPRRR